MDTKDCLAWRLREVESLVRLVATALCLANSIQEADDADFALADDSRNADYGYETMIAEELYTTTDKLRQALRRCGQVYALALAAQIPRQGYRLQGRDKEEE